MERRQFLAWGASGTAAAWLAACGGGGGEAGTAPPPPDPSPAPPPAPATGPSQAEWDGLARQLKGQLIRPGQADYNRVRLAANARFDDVLPQAVVRCAESADVQAALAFARRLQLPLTPRSGGHSYIGNSVSTGLVIDVGPMDGVSLDGDIATVGAGAKLADVYGALIAQGRCIPSGSCVTVGITGITLGGGFSVVDRAYGLGCDALVSARLITADGQELDCDAEHNADLFWALRGGGGGNFGIVSALRFRTHAVTPLMQFQASFSIDDLPAVMAAWQTWPQQGLPDAIWSQLVISPQGGSCLLWGLCVGDDTVLAPHWPALLARIGRTPVGTSVLPRSYREVMLGNCISLTTTQCHLPSQNADGRLGRVAMAASSDFFDTPLDTAGLQALADAVKARRGTGTGTLIFNLMGGAVGRVAPAATAFVHRGALFSAQYLAEFLPGSSADTVREGALWAHGMRATMQRWSSGRAYQNYLDALITDPLPAYYGGNLARLQQVKAAIDPGGVFRQAQGLA